MYDISWYIVYLDINHDIYCDIINKLNLFISKSFRARKPSIKGNVQWYHLCLKLYANIIIYIQSFVAK